MSKVLLDGKGFCTANCIVNNRMLTKKRNLSYVDPLMNLIYAIVLWDDIYVIDWCGRGHYEDFKRILENCEIPINTIRCTSLYIDDYLVHGTSLQKSDFFDHNIGRRTVRCDDESFDFKSVLDYINQAQIHGIDYMPSQDRTDIARRVMRISQTRDKIFSQLDTKLLEFYQQIEETTGININYKFPVLLDYLLENSNTEQDMINGALELKNSFKVKCFRKDLDRMEQALEEGNFIKYKDYYNSMKEILNEISKETNSSNSVQISLSPIPPFISVSKEFEITKKPFRFMWLKDLTRYGLTRRTMKKWNIPLV